MHRLFHVPELVHCIVDEAAGKRGEPHIRCCGSHDTGMRYDAYEAVTALGLTSRVFREASLDAIWHTQLTLIPLFRSVGLVQETDMTHTDEGEGIRNYVRLTWYLMCSP